MTEAKAPGIIRRIADGLANVMTGQGTSVDKSTHRHWSERMMDEHSVDVAYRGSWLMRRVVDIPAADAVRAGRDWQASTDQIELIEAEEKRLRVRAVLREGLIYGRLGGGLIVMGVNAGTPEDPLPETLPKQSLRYMKAYSRYRVELGPLISDPLDDDFGEPEWFKVAVDQKRPDIKVQVHRSRCLVFKGSFAGHIRNDGFGYAAHPFWGESIVSIVDDAVADSISVNREIAGLIEEAKIDVFGIPELLNMMGDPVREAQVARRLQLAQAGKSNHRAIVKDSLETFEQRQLNTAGFADLIARFLSIVSAASGIPATRLLGKSPDGQNATGESDQQNYDQMVNDIQEDDLRPAFDILDKALLPSALGSTPPDIYWMFAPTHVLTEQQAAEVESKEATSIVALVGLGIIPDEAMAQTVANRLVESGRWPGLEAALAKIGKEWWKLAPEPKIDPITGEPVIEPTPPAPGAPPVAPDKPPSAPPGNSGAS